MDSPAGRDLQAAPGQQPPKRLDDWLFADLNQIVQLSRRVGVRPGVNLGTIVTRGVTYICEF